MMSAWEKLLLAGSPETTLWPPGVVANCGIAATCGSVNISRSLNRHHARASVCFPLVSCSAKPPSSSPAPRSAASIGDAPSSDVPHPLNQDNITATGDNNRDWPCTAENEADGSNIIEVTGNAWGEHCRTPQSDGVSTKKNIGEMKRLLSVSSRGKRYSRAEERSSALRSLLDDARVEQRMGGYSWGPPLYRKDPNEESRRANYITCIHSQIVQSDARESPPVRRTASGGSTPGAYPDATPSVVTPRSDDHEAVSSVITTTFTPASTISPDTRGHDNTNSAAKKGADWPLGGLTKENLMLVGSGVGETDFDSDARFPEDSFLRCCGERTWSSRGWSNGSFAGDNHSCVSTGDPGQQTFHNFVYRRRGRPQSSRHFKAMTAAVEQSLTSLPPKFVRDEMGKLAVGPRGRGLQQLALSIGDNSEREADIRSVRRQRRRIGSETAVARWGSSSAAANHHHRDGKFVLPRRTIARLVQTRNGLKLATPATGTPASPPCCPSACKGGRRRAGQGSESRPVICRKCGSSDVRIFRVTVPT